MRRLFVSLLDKKQSETGGPQFSSRLFYFQAMLVYTTQSYIYIHIADTVVIGMLADNVGRF